MTTDRVEMFNWKVRDEELLGRFDAWLLALRRRLAACALLLRAHLMVRIFDRD